MPNLQACAKNFCVPTLETAHPKCGLESLPLQLKQEADSARPGRTFAPLNKPFGPHWLSERLLARLAPTTAERLGQCSTLMTGVTSPLATMHAQRGALRSTVALQVTGKSSIATMTGRHVRLGPSLRFPTSVQVSQSPPCSSPPPTRALRRLGVAGLGLEPDELRRGVWTKMKARAPFSFTP
jgi:hypothetical protein